jgi:hypothetical protein
MSYKGLPAGNRAEYLRFAVNRPVGGGVNGGDAGPVKPVQKPASCSQNPETRKKGQPCKVEPTKKQQVGAVATKGRSSLRVSAETGYNFTVLPNINRDLAAPNLNQPVKELQMNKLIVALIAGTFAAVASAQTATPAPAPAAAPAAPAKSEMKKEEPKKDAMAAPAGDTKKADKEAAAAKKKADKEAKAAKKKADKEAKAAANEKKVAAEKAAGDTKAPGMTQAQKDKMGQADLKAQEKTTGGSK